MQRVRDIQQVQNLPELPRCGNTRSNIGFGIMAGSMNVTK